MMKKKNQSPKQLRRAVAEELWLLYFNHTLLEKGLISESQRNRIAQLIYCRKSLATEK